MLIDQSSFAKLDVHGPGACAFLDRMCANTIDRPVGSVIYTQLLNHRGGIEADVTLVRLAHDRYQYVTGTAFGSHNLAWLRKHLPEDGSVYVDDITSARTCFCLWGPRARDILQPLTKSDLSNEAFPYMRAQEIAVGSVPLLASRVTYVGELGWELYAPTEYGLALYDLLTGAGASHGLRGGGYRAIESMRLEKGYRAWGTDLTPETTPESAGVGFAVRLDKPVPFIGQDALRAEREEGGPRERLACLVLEDPRSVCLGSEPVRIAGELCGRVTSGGYGSRVRRSIALAYVPAGHADGRHARRDRGVRGVGSGGSRGGSALRSGRRAHSRLSLCSSTTTCISRPTAPPSARRSCPSRAWRCTPTGRVRPGSTTSA